MNSVRLTIRSDSIGGLTAPDGTILIRFVGLLVVAVVVLALAWR